MGSAAANMSTFMLVVYVCLVVLFAYFGAANSTIQLLQYFRFYRPLSKKLEEYDVYTDKAYANLLNGRLLGNGIVFVATVLLSGFGAWRIGITGILAVIVAYLAGIALYSKKLRYELWNVQQFAKQYKEYLDKEKFTRFLRREYDISLEKLSDDAFVLQRLQKGK